MVDRPRTYIDVIFLFETFKKKVSKINFNFLMSDFFDLEELVIEFYKTKLGEEQISIQQQILAREIRLQSLYIEKENSEIIDKAMQDDIDFMKKLLDNYEKEFEKNSF